MLKRLILGIGKGSVVAAVVVAALLGLGASWSSPAVVYGAAVAVGVLAGLVGGRPVWSRGVKVEALVKSVVGSFIAVTAMFGIRKWLPHATVNLGSFGAGAIGAVPVAALPIVGSTLALLFEVDDGFGPEAGPRLPVRVAITDAPPALPDTLDDPSAVDESSPRSKRVRREG